jgi:hypothetical protein
MKRYMSAVPVLAGMELNDARIELTGEGRHPGALVCCHRHHDILRLEEPVARLDDEAAAISGQPIYLDAASDRELEPRRVRLQVVGHLVLAGKRVPRPGERQTREGVVTGRRKEPERVPPRSPRVADAFARVENHARETSFRQVVPHRQPSLPAADDHRLDTL